MNDRENYATARTLATIEHFGETFRIVRKRINGKPWRKYLTLCHGDISVSSSIASETDPVICAEQYKVLFARVFKSREALTLALEDIRAKRGGLIMKIVYQAATYRADLVTGVYARCHGKKPNYTFRVFEAASGTGRFAGKPGHGPTLREYDCDGSEFTSEFRERCIASKTTEKLR